jgi:hypothetical protein
MISFVFIVTASVPGAVPAQAALSSLEDTACLATNYDQDDIRVDIEKKRKFPDYLFEGFSAEQKKALQWAYDYVKTGRGNTENANYQAVVLLKGMQALGQKTDIEFGHLACMMALLAVKVIASDNKPADELRRVEQALIEAVRAKKVPRSYMAPLMKSMGKLTALNNIPPLSTLPSELGKHDVQSYMDAMIQLSGSVDVLVVFLLKEIREGEKLFVERSVLNKDNVAKRAAINKEIEQLHWYYKRVYAPLSERLRLDPIAQEIRNMLFDEIRVQQPEKYNEVMQWLKEKLSKKYPRTIQEVLVLLEPDDFGNIPQAADQLDARESGYLRVNRQEVQEQLLETYRERVENILKARGIKDVDIEVRLKDGYSLFEKMPKKDWDFNLISDLVGIRLIFPERSQMYRYAYVISKDLGEWNINVPIDERVEIKNQYDVGIEFCNEIVIDKDGIPIELQTMDRSSYTLYHNSPFAHWLYKAQQINADSKQIFEYDRVEFTPDRREYFKMVTENLSRWVYVFTTEAFNKKQFMYRPMQLPAGSIPSDFASSGSINALGEDYWGVVSSLPVDVNKKVSAEGVMIEVVKSTKRKVDYEFQPGEFVRLAGPQYMPKNAKIEKGAVQKAKQKQTVMKSLLEDPQYRNPIMSNAKKNRTKYIAYQYSAKQMEYPDAQGIIRKRFAELDLKFADKNKRGSHEPISEATQFMDSISPLLGFRNKEEVFGAMQYGIVTIKDVVSMYRGRLILKKEGINVFNMKEVEKKRLDLAVGLLGVRDILSLLKEVGAEDGDIDVKDVARLVHHNQEVSFSMPDRVDLENIGRGVHKIRIVSKDDNGDFLLSRVREVITQKLGLDYDMSEMTLEKHGDDSVLSFPLYINDFNELEKVMTHLRTELSIITGGLQIQPLKLASNAFEFRDVRLTFIADDPKVVEHLLTVLKSSTFSARIVKLKGSRLGRDDIQDLDGADDEDDTFFELDMQVPQVISNSDLESYLTYLEKSVKDAEHIFSHDKIQSYDTAEIDESMGFIIAA